MGTLAIAHPDNNDGEGIFSPIAVCGMALRLPGGISSPNQFWDFLLGKGNARTGVPLSRFDSASHCSTFGNDGLLPTDQGYFLDQHPGELDTSFFSFTKAELEYIDPHQRHLLEVVYECFETAGEANYRGANIGCYVGSFSDDWTETLLHDLQMYGKYPVLVGGDYSIPNRISFEYDLRGPSVSIRTACSSTIVALTEACSAIAGGECDAAIVAGCQFILSPTMSTIMSTRGMLSPDATCKSFDAAANGYGRGEAINAVYLKPLAAALRDGNPVRGIIRSSVVNSDGKTAGFSVPSTEAQEALIRKAYRIAGINDHCQTAFIECHGTGTSVGDPIEASTIARVYEGHEIFIGSVKPNIGHSEGASGLTSFIKTIMAVEKGIIPPNINFQTPNPRIPFSEGGLTVPTEPIPWPPNRPVRAGINSFGMGGVNAHVVVDSARSLAPQLSPSLGGCPGATLLVFSANTKESLAQVVEKNHAYLESHPQTLPDLAYTLGARRAHLPFRTFSVVSEDGTTQSFPPYQAPEQQPDVVMVFTGQGAQWPGMGAQLYETNRAFRESLHEAQRVLRELPEAPEWSIVEEIRKEAAESNLDRALYSQPICTAVQIALVDALAELNVKPFAVVGHSSGELAAAYASGRLSAREAMICAFCRGLVSGQVERAGAMAAIGLGKDEVEPFLGPGVAVACENSPTSVTISGDLDLVKKAMEDIKTHNPKVLVRQLKVDTAYHSLHMKDVGGRYKLMLDGYLRATVSPIPFASSVSGKLLESEILDSEYWQRNLESPVQFRHAVEAILDDFKQPLFFLEVGSHSALSAPLRQTMDHRSLAHPYGSCLLRSKPCSESFLGLVGQLYTQKQPLRWDVLTNRNGSAKVLADAPTYSWDHSMSKLYEPRSIRAWKHSRFPRHELLGTRVTYSTDDQPCWRNVLFFKHVPWIYEHGVLGNAVFPAAGYVLMAIEAVRQVAGTSEGGFQIRNLQMSMAMVLDRYSTTEIITSLRRRNVSWYDFSISSHNGLSWIEHCAGSVRCGCCLTAKRDRDVEKSLPRSINTARWYQTLARKGVGYGESFQGIRSLRSSTSQCYASAEVVSTVQDTVYYPIHPTKLDACFQTVYAAAYQGLEWKIGQLPVPTRFGELNILDSSSNLTCTASAQPMRKGAIGSRLEAYMPDGTMVLSLDDTVSQPLGTQHSPDNTSMIGARLHWARGIDFLPLKDLISLPSSWGENARVLRELTQACIEEALSRLEKHSVSTTISHLQKYHGWLRRQHSMGKISGPLWEDVTKRSLATPAAPYAAAMIKVVDNIIPLCKGEVDPVELLMSDDTPLKMYDYLNLVDRSPLFQALGHHNPSQRILEIGAGTGGTTARILAETAYSTYTFTDISAAFFPAAKARFQAYPNMVFKTLDITKDPLSQEFLPESFDLIVASNVLHATPSLRETLLRVRQLLHPRGKLLLEELCGEIKYANIVSGVLSGWWAGEEDDRADEPYVSPGRWEAELRAAGFDGLDGLAFDAAPPVQSMAYMLASPNATDIMSQRETVLVSDTRSTEITVLFQNQLRSRGYDFVVRGMGESLPGSSDAIVLVDTVEPFFHGMTSTNLASFQRFLRELQRSHSRVLWVTRSSQVVCKDPRYSLAIGAARTSRTEFGVDFATCEVDTLDYSGVALTIDVFEQFQRHSNQTEAYLREMEYAVHENSVLVGRMIPFSMQEEIMNPGYMDFDRTRTKLLFDPDTEEWVLRAREPTLEANEVEIEVDTAGVSYLDARAAADTTPFDVRLGFDAAGTVRRVGSQITDLSPGDRVIALWAGYLSTSITVPRERCAIIPDGLSLKDASTMPLAFSTALLSLVDVGQLTKCQAVLIHSASGGIGSAAIQISQMLGATVYATVGSDEKAESLEEIYGISKSRIFSSCDDSFVRGIKQATQGYGVDLVLNTSRDLFAASCECLAHRGKLVNLVKLSEETQVPSKLSFRNVTLITVDVFEYLDTQPENLLLRRITDLYSREQIRPLHIGETFLARDAAECLRAMETRQRMGKMLLSFNEEPLPQPSRLLEAASFRSDASYLLVGGLGGLGRGIAQWMAEKNAAHLVFLSRNADAESHEGLFRELEDKGCTVTAVKGDVSILADVEKAISASPAPLKGIFNMSMVLRDESFLAMHLDDWKAATDPKVQGTWNLHEASRCMKLDFFVLFSSMCGIIGMPGQANYAAANTFMDAFVQYRQHQHLPASVIDVGPVDGIGWTADNPQVLERSAWLKDAVLSQQELFQATTIAVFAPRPVNPETRLAFTQSSQIITGFRSTRALGDGFHSKTSLLDHRLVYYSNLDARNGIDDANAGCTEIGSDLQQFIATLPGNIHKLDDPSTSTFIATETAAWIFDLLLKPIKDGAEVDLSRSFFDIGFDSLAATELRTWWKAVLGLEISVLEIMSFANLAAMGDFVVQGLKAKLEFGIGGK